MGGGPDPLSDDEIHATLDELEGVGFVTTEGYGEKRTVQLTMEGTRALSVLSPFIPPVLVQQMMAISMAVKTVLARQEAEAAEAAEPDPNAPRQLYDTPPGGQN